jgi:alpha-L-arabinofuranosidase
MWDRQGDVFGGVFAAEMLNMFCREAETLRLEMANYFQPVTEGAIRVTPTGCYLDPDGQVFAMFAAHQNNILLDVAAPPDLSGLDVCASISKDKKRIFITAINRNANEEKTLLLSLKNFVYGSESVLHSLIPASLNEGAAFVEKKEKIRHSEDKSISLVMPPCGIVGITIQ